MLNKKALENEKLKEVPVLNTVDEIVETAKKKETEVKKEKQDKKRDIEEFKKNKRPAYWKSYQTYIKEEDTYIPHGFDMVETWSGVAHICTSPKRGKDRHDEGETILLYTFCTPEVERKMHENLQLTFLGRNLDTIKKNRNIKQKLPVAIRDRFTQVKLPAPWLYEEKE